MKIEVVFALALSLVISSGCETLQQIDATAGEWAREMKAQPAARAEEPRHRRVLTAKTVGCQRVDQSLTVRGIDPDTAYLRIKRHFGYQTFEEANKTMYPGWLETTHFRHETLPGVRYSLAQDINWTSTVYGRNNLWLDLDIERERSHTQLLWHYCINTDGWEKLGDPDAIQRHLAHDIQRVVLGARP